jgi:hypothetical protein
MAVPGFRVQVEQYKKCEPQIGNDGPLGREKSGVGPQTSAKALSEIEQTEVRSLRAEGRF